MLRSFNGLKKKKQKSDDSPLVSGQFPVTNDTPFLAVVFSLFLFFLLPFLTQVCGSKPVLSNFYQGLCTARIVISTCCLSVHPKQCLCGKLEFLSLTRSLCSHHETCKFYLSVNHPCPFPNKYFAVVDYQPINQSINQPSNQSIDSQ